MSLPAMPKIQDDVLELSLLDPDHDRRNFTIWWYQFLSDLLVYIAGLSISGGGGTSLWLPYDLTSASTAIPSPGTPIDGALATLKIAQDSVGGRLVVFDTAFKLVRDGDVNPLPDWVTVINFVGGDGFWWMKGSYSRKAS